MVPAKILFVDQAGTYGGAEYCLADVVRYYGSRGLVILFNKGPFQQDLVADGVPVEVDPLRALSHVKRNHSRPSFGLLVDVLRTARTVARRGQSYDVIYANSQKAFVVSALAAAISRRPLIWHLHDLLTTEHFSSSNVKMVVFLANRFATRVLVNSHAMAEAFVTAGGSSSKVHVVPVGVAAAPFLEVSDATARDARISLGLSEHASVVGLFGRLAEWKGQNVAIDAMTELPGVHLLVVGDAMFGERRYAEQLHQRARECGVADRVHFTGFRRDIPVLMRSVDLIIHTSTMAEPFGRVLVEGMLSARPLVTTPAGGVPEIVDDGKTGLFVPPSDAHRLAQAVSDLLADPERRVHLGLAARSTAVERFTTEAMLRAIDRHIEAVANSSRERVRASA